MKITTTSTIFVFLAVIAIGVTTTPAFADHMKADVSVSAGASSPGCETTNSCFTPDEVTVDVGGEVTWTNGDSAAHTVTSGDLKADPDNVGTIFDSSLFQAGKTFSHKFDTAGEFPYFCMVHPWMTGKVIVQEAMAETPTETPTAEMTELYGMSSDSSIKVEVSTSTPTAGQAMTIDVKFMDATATEEKMIEHINYDIAVTQGDTTVLGKMAEHQHQGSAQYMTDALGSADPVDIKITLNGIGLPDSDPSTWTGPKGDVVMFNVVPEFGTIAMMILGVAIVSIVAVTAKTKVIPRL